MFTLRKAFGFCAVFLLLFLAACGAPASTESPAQQYDYEQPAATEEAAAYDAYEEPAASPQQGGNPPSENEPTDMFFENYGVNPSIDAEDDNLSTFALDVDTGS